MRRQTTIVSLGVILLSCITLFFIYLIFLKPPTLRDFSKIRESGVLNIVTTYNSVDYYISSDTIQGLQYALCKRVEQRSGLKVNIFLENNLETCIQKLQNNIYDVIAMSLPITAENRKKLNFTVPITQNKQVLVQRKPAENDSGFINNQIQLAHKTVYVQQNSPVILRLKNLSEEIAEPIYIQEVPEYSAEQLIYMVNGRSIDYAVVDKQVALQNSKLFPNIDIQTDISFTQLQAWAVRKNTPVLLDSLNQWISEEN